ncbi:MAG: hypothetical protein AABZ64_14290, partial [Nitrospinota bacterium]
RDNNVPLAPALQARIVSGEGGRQFVLVWKDAGGRAHDISLMNVIQKGRAGREDYVPLVLLTHEAIEEDMQNALKEIARLDVVRPEYAMIRVVLDGMAFV